MSDSPSPTPALPFAVEVVRSRRRRKSVAGQLTGGVLTVTVPSWMSVSGESEAVDDMVRRFARRHSADRIDLARRAAGLARRHDLPKPDDIDWSERMQARWGSCTPATGSVRVSAQLVPFPAWVLDYVIVHELAHLAVADHSPRFWALVDRYPLAERARGYLLAKAGDVDDL